MHFTKFLESSFLTLLILFQSSPINANHDRLNQDSSSVLADDSNERIDITPSFSTFATVASVTLVVAGVAYILYTFKDVPIAHTPDPVLDLLPPIFRAPHRQNAVIDLPAHYREWQINQHT